MSSDAVKPIQMYEIKSLTEDQKTFIKASVPVLELSGEELTRQFYEYMLGNFPEVKVFFNPSNQATLKQPKILAFALLNYAKNIDDITPLVGFVNQVCVKHCGLQIQPEHYPIVGVSLITTMKNLLGKEIATEAFVEAWSTAYGNLAQILINAEHELYLKQNWEGFREFEVSRIVDECSDVKSVYFVAKDGARVVPVPGQYLALEFYPYGKANQPQLREYSISSTTSGGQFRISVRLIQGGVISNYIHHELEEGDKFRVAPPTGTLFNEQSTKDLVVFAGGIGITPMVSIIEKALSDGRKVKLNYSNLSNARRPFGDWLEKLQAQYESFTVQEFIANKLLESDFNSTELRDKEIYMIGPQPYMDFVGSQLKSLGVENINTEAFGPMSV